MRTLPLLCLALAACDPPAALLTPDQNAANQAYEVAKGVITKALLAPATARYPASNAPDVYFKLKDDTFAIKSYVDAQNPFGALVRNEWTAIVAKDGRALAATLGDDVLFDRLKEERQKKLEAENRAREAESARLAFERAHPTPSPTGFRPRQVTVTRYTNGIYPGTVAFAAEEQGGNLMLRIGAGLQPVPKDATDYRPESR